MGYVEYGCEEITVVYLVEEGTHKDLIAMPVLFKENSLVMGKILREISNSIF